jgi:TRAP-type C4-dicarboxylate transport system substrate-binding protein
MSGQFAKALALTTVAALSAPAMAEPVTLKFAYTSSDRTSVYRTAIAPFVEAVNGDSGGHVRIEVALSGELGRSPAEQADLVLNGTADVAFVVTGLRPDLFPDDTLIQLPGFLDGMAEATHLYRTLVEDGTLGGYQQFFPVGVFAGEPETFHARSPIASIADIAGKRIRVSNPLEAATIAKLGGTPVFLPITQIAAQLGSGEIDAALVPASDPLVEFGIARIAAHHYLLDVSTVPLAILMNREVFDSLPDAAREVIVRHSGAWLAERFVEHTEASTARVLAELKATEQRTVVEPSAADLEVARVAFQAVIDDWVATDPRNAELLARAEAEIEKAE